MKTAIVGCGAIAGRWIRSLAADGRLDVAVLVDPNRRAAERLAEQFGLDVAHAATIEQALSEHRLGVMVNLTPPQDHARTSRNALEGGVHVVSEKPLTLRLTDAISLVTLAKRRRLVLAVMQNRGRDPQFLDFCDQVRLLGAPPYFVTADKLVPLNTPGFRRDQILPITSDLAVHAFDQIRSLISAAPVEITCVETPASFLDSHCAVAMITVRFADDSLFCYRGAFIAATAHRTDAGGVWRVEGGGFAASWTGGTAVTVADNAGRRTVGLPEPPAVPSYQACITAMIDSIERPAGAECPAVDSLASIALLDAALTSATERRTAPVPAEPRRLR